MKALYFEIRDFIRENFHPGLYLSTGIFLTLALILNYSFDFKNEYIDPYTRTPWKSVFSFFFLAGPFLVVCSFIYILGLNRSWIKDKDFWVKFFFGFGFLSLDLGFYGYQILQPHLKWVEYLFSISLINWASGVFIIIIPLSIFYHYYEKDNSTFYGLAPKKLYLKPYLILFGIAAIFIAAGSFLGDIQGYYPTYKRSNGHEIAELHKIPEWISVLTYEITYGTSFISVEFFFRGFLVLAFCRILGPAVLLPMCASYCFLHFGKPLGESISSIFGGYVLGIIAYNTRHIYGGILIHLGVAWLMELLAYLQSLWST